jgi:hypothetical protein
MQTRWQGLRFHYLNGYLFTLHEAYVQARQSR